MNYIIRPSDSDCSDRLGGKARALADLQRTDMSIPKWIVLAPAAFWASLNNDVRRVLEDSENAFPANGFFSQLALGHEPRRELKEALKELCPNGERVAVR